MMDVYSDLFFSSYEPVALMAKFRFGGGHGISGTCLSLFMGHSYPLWRQNSFKMTLHTRILQCTRYDRLFSFTHHFSMNVFFTLVKKAIFSVRNNINQT
jgi:hypothetical protein